MRKEKKEEEGGAGIGFQKSAPPKMPLFLAEKVKVHLFCSLEIAFCKRKTQLDFVLLVTWFPSKLFQETIEVFED